MWFKRSAAQRRSRFNDDELATKENEIEASDFNVQQAKQVFMSGHIHLE